VLRVDTALSRCLPQLQPTCCPDNAAFSRLQLLRRAEALTQYADRVRHERTTTRRSLYPPQARAAARHEPYCSQFRGDHQWVGSSGSAKLSSLTHCREWNIPQGSKRPASVGINSMIGHPASPVSNEVPMPRGTTCGGFFPVPGLCRYIGGLGRRLAQTGARKQSLESWATVAR
jgi:hypothetical protein